MANEYIGLYKADGARISEGTGDVPLEPDDFIMIPASGQNESNIIQFSIKTASGYKTYGNTTLRPVNGTNTNNRWMLSTSADFAGATYGGDCVITSAITSAGLTLYAKARALGPISDEFTETGDMLDDDISVDIQIITSIIKG